MTLKFCMFLCLAGAALGQYSAGPGSLDQNTAGKDATSIGAAARDSTPVLIAQDRTPGEPPQAAPSEEQKPPADQDRSVLGVRPGTEAIKDKDLYEASGFLHPFRRMPKFTLVDQRRIWLSPFHTKRENIKWWIIFGGATAALVAADQHIENAAPTNSTLVHLGNDFSYLGTAQTLVPIAATMYLIGSGSHEERFRETGLLSFEALISSTIVQEAVKSITDRQRPNEPNSEGHFFASSNPRYNSSFPSGHAMQTFTLASIFAHEYHDKLWVRILAYAYAGGVVGARLAAKQHFAGDVVPGAAMGWFIGDYVYGKRHNPQLDGKPNVLKKIASHAPAFSVAW